MNTLPMPVLQYRFRLTMKTMKDDSWVVDTLTDCEIDYLQKTITLNIRESLEKSFSDGLRPIPKYPKEVVIDYFDGQSSCPHRGELFTDLTMIHFTKRLDYSSQDPVVNRVIYTFK